MGVKWLLNRERKGGEKREAMGGADLLGMASRERKRSLYPSKTYLGRFRERVISVAPPKREGEK